MPFDPTTAQPLNAAPAFDPATATPFDSGGGGESASAAAPGSDPTEGMSTPDRLAAGIGKGMVDLGRGTYQLGASLGHAAGLVSDDKMAEIQKNVDEAHERDKPLMATTSGRVGDIIGQAAPMLAMPGAGIVGTAAEGALTGAMQPVATGDSRMQNVGAGAVGGALGAAGGKLVGGVLGGFGGAGERQGAVDLLRSEGIPVSVAQATKSKAAQSIERASAMTSDDATEFAGTQQQAFSKAAMRRMGVNDPTVTAATPKVMGDTDDRIGAVMNGVMSRTRPQFDTAFAGDLQSIQRDLPRMMPDSDAGPITTNINDILSNAAQNGGYLDGTFVQKLQSNLKTLAQNPTYQPVAHDLMESVHNVVNRYASPQDAADMLQAQRQFRAMKQIEGATDKASGNISVPSLLNQMGQKAYGGRNQVLYGRGDQSLVDLARAAKQVIPDNLGNSGTAERSLPALTGLEILASGDVLKAGTKAAVSIGGVNSAGRALRSQGVLGKYLQNGVPVLNNLAPDVNAWAPVAGYGISETQPRDADATPRASGGRVDHEALVSRLMTRWNNARKSTTADTKPLLHVPDASIIRALDIAQAHL
jgi:hypothetical protein